MINTNVIIPTYNAVELLKECVNSISKHTDEEYEIIVVDNGSDDGTYEYCCKERITMISLPWQQTFITACNNGLKLSSGENLVIMTEKTIVKPHWLTDMLEDVYLADQIGIARPTSTAYVNESGLNKWQRIEQISNECILMKRELIVKIGYFQKPQTPGSGIFDDYCERARQAGYRWVKAGKVDINRNGGRQS